MKKRRILLIVIPAMTGLLALVAVTWLFAAVLPDLNPSPNEGGLPLNIPPVSVKYNNVDIWEDTVNSDSLVVHGMFRGQISGDVQVTEDILFKSIGVLWPGEVLYASAPGNFWFIDATSPDTPTVWQFNIGAFSGNGAFTETGQAIQANALDVALGDLDRDQDLDAVLVGFNGDAEVWINEAGAFTPGHVLTNAEGDGVALGDLDGDGYLDAFIAPGVSGAQVWMNQGDGTFLDSGQTLENDSGRPALGDLDGDGDLDAITVNFFAGTNAVWFNDGDGVFSPGNQSLEKWNNVVVVGDVDTDGDLDAIFGRSSGGSGPATPIQIWLNDGDGDFSPGQAFGEQDNFVSDLAIIDLNRDRHLDLVSTSSWGFRNKVWINNGDGTYSDSGQDLGSTGSATVAAGNISGNPTPDLLFANGSHYDLWLNDGSAGFTYERSLAIDGLGETVVLGDLDGDLLLDALLEDYDPFGNNPDVYELWRGGTSSADLELFFFGPGHVSAEDNEATFTVQVSNNGQLTAVNTELTLLYSPAYSTTNWSGPPGLICNFLICQLGDIAPGETVNMSLTLSFVENFAYQAAIDRYVYMSVDSDTSDRWLSDNEYWQYLTFYSCKGFDSCSATTVWCELIEAAASAISTIVDLPFHLPDLYALRDQVMGLTEDGRRYIDLYYKHDAEINLLFLADGDLRDQAIAALGLWQPNVSALVNGTGDSLTITAEQAAAVDDFLTALSAAGSQSLQDDIAAERALLPPPADFIGMSVNDARGVTIGHAVLLPAVMKE